MQVRRGMRSLGTVLGLNMLLASLGCGGSAEPYAPPGGGTGTGPTSQGTVESVAVLGGGQHTLSSVDLTVVATAADGLSTPRDLAFNPEAPEQLWILNHADDSMVVFGDIARDGSARKYQGRGNTHFLAAPAALAFGAPGTMATAQEEDERTQAITPADFMGPSLWPTDLSLFNAGHASHLDMLHDSPNATGIAWDRDNVYWVYDGHNRAITRYDFREDHGPGGSYHGDGEIARYVEGEVGYQPGVSSHMQLDHDTGLLYVADTANARIVILDTNTGEKGARTSNYDRVNSYKMDGARLSALVEGVGLVQPSGLVLHDGLIFVSDNQTSHIRAFDLQGRLIDWLNLSDEVDAGGLMGMDFDADGGLYVTDAVGNRVLRIRAR